MHVLGTVFHYPPRPVWELRLCGPSCLGRHGALQPSIPSSLLLSSPSRLSFVRDSERGKGCLSFSSPCFLHSLLCTKRRTGRTGENEVSPNPVKASSESLRELIR